MGGSFEVGSIIARIAIDDAPFVKQGRALLTKAKKLGKDLNAALKSTGLGAVASGAAGAATGAASAAVGVGLGAAGGTAGGAGVAGVARNLQAPRAFEGGDAIVRKAEELGRRIREALERGFLGGVGGGRSGVIPSDVPLLEGGGNELVRQARVFGAQVKDAIRDAEFRVINPEPTIQSFRRIRGAAKALARFMRGTVRLAFKLAFKIPVRLTLLSFKAIRGAARLTARAVSGVGSGVGRAFRGLRRALFGLPQLIAAVGSGLIAAGLVRRAKEIESTRIAFENLTGAVGENADSFIKDLRKATRGAVSDLELFRVTNNAALLGVVQSKEQYVRLASAARRLGRAVGRTTVDAINDLSVGIGRQSRLILDNLGIVVRVDEANEKYAQTLGVARNKLTVFDKQQAFLNAALDAADEKVKRLGPDVLTLNDAVGRFGAVISNTATIVAEAFIGPGPFNAISDFLERNAANIQAFATLVADTFSAIIRVGGRIINRIFSGGSARTLGNRISNVLNGLARFTFRVISLLLSNIFGELGFLILGLFTGLLASIGNAIIVEIGSFFLSIGAEIDKLIVKIASKIPGLSGLLGLDEPGAVEEINRELDAAAGAFTDELKAFGNENQKFIDQFVGEATEQVAKKGAEAVEEAKASLADLTKETKRKGSIFAEEIVKGFDEIEVASKRFKEATEKNVVTPLRDLSAQSQKSQKKLAAISDQFAQLIQPFESRVRNLQLEVQTIGLEESAAELKKFDLEFEGFDRTLEEFDLKKLKSIRENLRKLLEQRDAKELAAEFVEDLEKIEERVVSFADAIDKARVGDLAIEFRELNREFERTLKTAPVERVDELREKFDKLKEGLARAEVTRVSADLAQLSLQLQDVEASGAEIKIRELEAGFKQFEAALRESGLAAEKVNDILRSMRGSVDDLQEAEVFGDLKRSTADLKQATADARFELEQIGKTEIKQEIAGISREFDEQIKKARGAADALLELRREQGASAGQIAVLEGKTKKFIQTLEELRAKQIKTAKASEESRRTTQIIEDISLSIEKNVGRGLINAFSKGEDLGKQWASILGGFVEDAMEKAIKNLTKLLKENLTELFQNMSGGSAIGGLALGLIGVGAAILQNLDSKSQSTIEDFDDAINSSEAVRGVVAGPTNVAISKIGDSLKQAMRTTEILLSEILATLQSSGGGIGGATLESNAALPLSTSSTS